MKRSKRHAQYEHPAWLAAHGPWVDINPTQPIIWDTKKPALPAPEAITDSQVCQE